MIITFIVQNNGLSTGSDGLILKMMDFIIKTQVEQLGQEPAYVALTWNASPPAILHQKSRKRFVLRDFTWLNRTNGPFLGGEIGSWAKELAEIEEAVAKMTADGAIFHWFLDEFPALDRSLDEFPAVFRLWFRAVCWTHREWGGKGSRKMMVLYLQMMIFVFKMMDFVFKMMIFVFKMMIFYLQMMDFVFKMMIFVFKMMDFVFTNDDFCI